MKTLSFLGGMFFAIISISMLFFLFQTITGQTTINPEVIQSGPDKIFWSLTMVGCAGFYTVISVSLFRRINPTKNTTIMAFGVIASIAFIVGLYYTFIFGSPL